MKRLRIFVVGALMAAFLVVGAGPASANCAGDPDVCAAVCQVGLGNKYTHDLFKFCYVL